MNKQIFLEEFSYRDNPDIDPYEFFRLFRLFRLFRNLSLSITLKVSFLDDPGVVGNMSCGYVGQGANGERVLTGNALS